VKRLLLVAVTAVVAWFALSPQWRSIERMGERRFQTLSQPAKEILVGVVWPFATNQDGMADGLQLARDEINAGGLAGGLPIRLLLRDDGFEWQKTKNIAIEFSDTPNMTAVIGYYDDSQAIKASVLYESSRLLHLITGANNTSMTGRGDQYIVRTILPSDKIARSLARMSVARGYQKFAVIWEEDAYGEDLAYQFRVGLDSLNAQLVYQWSYSRERVDFRMPVNELKGIDADVIFFAGLEPWAGDFIRQARGVGIKTPILGAFSDTPEMRERAGPAIEGAMYFEIYNPNSPTPENQAFVRKFRARFARDPDAWAAQGYDALHILANAIRSTGSRNPLDLSYAIRYMNAWEGANGRYKFDSRGELEDKPLFVNVYRNGRPVTLQESTPAPVHPDD
jgi:branched-chain amino acid transport system substrate-binding protein